MGFTGEVSFLLASIFVLHCLAQSNRQFQWSFRDKRLSDLPTCSPLSIIVESFDPVTDLTTGIPPYYMISYPIGGQPITSFLGIDTDNLTWTPSHPLNSEVILNVVDSTGGSGGVSSSPRKIVAGVTTGCIVNADNVDTFVVSANVSGSLNQCESWGITVSGGFPPYVVMLAETSSPVVTNSTPLAVGAISFPKRVNLGGSLVVAVADAQGQWASGTPVVRLEASTDRICTPALPFTPSTTSKGPASGDVPRPPTPSALPSGPISPSVTPSPITSQGSPATVQIEIVFQSPRTDIAATPTSSGVTSRPISSNIEAASTTPNSNSVARRRVKAIALGLSIPLAIILTTACGVLVFCLCMRRRRRSESEQVVYRQPSPFITTPGGTEGYESTYNGSLQQRVFNARREAKLNWGTGGSDVVIAPSVANNMGDQSSSQVTLATRSLRPLLPVSVLEQDPTTGHRPVRNDIEGPPDYQSHLSEPSSPRI